MNNITLKTAKAFKWSSITEILAKIISPVINMLLARILAPEAFGVLATISMVISFAEVLVESGFQKFLIQHNFESFEEEQKYMSVAFWANLAFSLFIWGTLIIFCEPVAMMAGNAGLGLPLAVTGLVIPLHSVIGMQNCQLKKDLDFKGLFIVRTISAFVPLVVTLPLAMFGFDYWSLVIGNIAGAIVQSAILLFVGKFKPNFFFSYQIFKHMLSFGIWTLLDGFAIWATSWIDSLLIAHFLDDYYLGLYKNSSSTITMLFSIVTAALTPVLFSALSKLQDDDTEFKRLFLNIQKLLCTFLIPLSVGVYFYREFATWVLFGDQWGEAADIIGIMAITTVLRTIFVSTYGDAFRAKGHFKVPLVLQLIDLLFMIPACIISVNFGFWPLVYTRAFIKLDLIVPDLFLVKKICNISIKETLKMMFPSLLSTLVMVVAIVLLQMVNQAVVWSIVSIIICIVLYFCVLFMFKEERNKFLYPIIKKIKK